MSNYGVTKNGFVRKRYDDIYAELQNDIKDATGVDISINPKSYINVLLSSVADKLAALHELAEAVYYAHYPSTADGVNLDYACQFGGLSRQEGESTKYSILCTGTDGTSIPSGTRIASTTSPVKYFTVNEDYTITRLAFNKATLRLMSIATETSYVVYLDGSAYSYIYKESDTATEEETDEEEQKEALKLSILKGLKAAIDAGNTAFTVTVDEDNGYLIIESNNVYCNYELDMNEYITTEDVSTIIVFESEELAKIKLPENSITEIITSISGFSSCTNLAIPVYGRERETDIELRQSYLKKQAYRSSTMLSSITSAILNTVDEVTSASGFENDSDETDEYGRPPHSIEIVVDGGSDAEIAQQILYYKAAGIQTYGSVAVDVPTGYNSTVQVKFSRPSAVYVWLKVTLSQNPDEAMPTNYEELVKTAILEYVDDITAGENVVIQKAITNINAAVSGIAYCSIKAAYFTDSTIPSDSDYTHNYITVDAREKAYFDEDRIMVVTEG